jgi:hypothetical protein
VHHAHSTTVVNNYNNTTVSKQFITRVERDARHEAERMHMTPSQVRIYVNTTVGHAIKVAEAAKKGIPLPVVTAHPTIAPGVHANPDYMLGLNKPSTDADKFHATDMDFALYVHRDGHLYVYENGIDRGPKATYTHQDTMQIRVSTANKVEYAKNGKVFYTSKLPPTYPLVRSSISATCCQ